MYNIYILYNHRRKYYKSQKNNYKNLKTKDRSVALGI